MQQGNLSRRAGRGLMIFAVMAGALGASAGVASAQGYQVSMDPVGLSSIENTMGVVQLYDATNVINSDEVETVQLPFPFEFFGNAVTSVDISSNGFLSFEPVTTLAFENQSLQPYDPSTPTSVVAVLWKDLDYSSVNNSRLMHVTTGQTPNRQFIVEFNAMDQYLGFGAVPGAVKVTGQIVLHEDGRIELRYADPQDQVFGPLPTLSASGPAGITAGLKSGAALSATVGVPGADGLFSTPMTNNITFTPQTATSPELTGSVAIAQTHVQVGTDLTVSRTLQNLGLAAGPLAYEFRLSTDATIDSSDPLLGSFSLASLGAAVSDQGFDVVTIPQGTTAGTYFVGLIVDSNAAFTEANEMDNAIASGTTINVGMAAYTRSVFSSTYTSIRTTGTPLFDSTLNPDDDATAAVTLPFSFLFYGVSATTLEVSTNGWVAFSPQATLGFINAPLPTATTPNNMIAALWEDLELNANGTAQILTETQMLPGGRVFIIEYSELTRSSQIGGTLAGSYSAQIALFEGTNRIELRYPDPAAQTFEAGTAYTAGIEDPSGATAFGALNLQNSNTMPPTINVAYDEFVPAVPDLSASRIDATQTHILQSLDAEVARSVGNINVDVTTDVELLFVLSTDATIDTGDIIVGTATITGGIVAGQQSDGRVTISIPAGLASGDYTLGMIVDPNDLITETDETNNTVAFALPVTVGAGTLTRERVTPPTAYTSILGLSGTTALMDQTQFPMEIDEEEVTFAAPFAFRFFGQSVTDVTVHSNGFLVFDQVTPVNAFINDPVPSGNPPNGLIAAFWTDLINDGASSMVLMRVAGTSPSRILTIEWRDFVHFDAAAGSVASYSGQVRLHEGSNRIEIQKAPSFVPEPGQGFTSGVESSSNLEGYGCENLRSTNAVASLDEFRFEATSLPGVELVAGRINGQPTTVEVGQTLAVITEVTNLGDTAAASVVVGFYLSTDSDVDTSDDRIGELTVASIAPGASPQPTAVLTVPPGTAPGSYFLAPIVDDGGLITESIESNNVGDTLAVTVIPAGGAVDIATTAAMAQSATVAVGGSLMVDRTVANIGLVDSSPINVRLVLSTDQYFDGGDVTVQQTFGQVITAGGMLSGAVTANIPATVQPGTYFLGVIADDANAHRETDEANNIASAGMITVTPNPAGPDLVITALSVTPAVAAPGDVVMVTRTVTNVGGAEYTNQNFDFEYRLSANDFISTTDDLQQTESQFAQTIAAGASDTQTFAVTILATQAEGPYFLGATLANTSGETSTGNNDMGTAANRLLPTPVVIRAAGTMITQLVPSGVMTVDNRTVTPGSSLTLTLPRLLNNGTEAVSNVRVGVYLSSFRTQALFAFDPATDFEIGTFTVASIAPGMSAGPATITVTVPQTALPGLRTIGIVMDDQDMILEAQEGDNGLALLPPEITIESLPSGADLIPQVLTVTPSAVAPGDMVTLNRTIANLGANPAGTFRVSIVLSDDTTIDGNDPVLDTFEVTGGLVGQGVDGPTAFMTTIPGGTADGSYFVGLIVDYLAAVDERDETNNTISTPLTVQNAAPCDVDLSGGLNVSDVQQVINVALALPSVTPNGREDVNGDGLVNVSDVQRVINGVLGGSCP